MHVRSACTALKSISCVKHNKVEWDTLLLLFDSTENSTKPLHFMFDLISVVDFWNDLLLVNAVQQHVLHKL